MGNINQCFLEIFSSWGEGEKVNVSSDERDIFKTRVHIFNLLTPLSQATTSSMLSPKAINLFQY